MKRFIVKILIFMGAIYCISWGLDYIICKGLLKMDDYRFQDYKAMLDGTAECDVLIMGNSRGKSHYDPHLIDSLLNVNSFCIGIGGYPIDAQIAKLNLYLEHNKAPNLIIQDIGYMTVAEIKDVRHRHQSEQFFPLIYDKRMRSELKDLGYGFLELYVPLYRMLGYQMVIKNGILEMLHIKHYISCPAYKGHRPEEGPWNGTELEKMETHKITMSEDAKTKLENYLQQCKDNSIEVILVNSPMYVGAIEKIENFDEAKEYFQSLASKYGFRYLDYTDTCSISQSKNNFCVSVHMNPKATKEFTKMLCEDLAR